MSHWPREFHSIQSKPQNTIPIRTCSLNSYHDFLFILDPILWTLTARSSAPQPRGLSPSPQPLPLLWWRPHKREIHTDGLIQQFGLIRPFNGSLRLALCGIFDQSVALHHRRKAKSQSLAPNN